MTNKLSRRGFLNLAGAVGGSTTVYRAAVALGSLAGHRACRTSRAGHSQEAEESPDSRRRHLGSHGRLRAVAQRLRRAGARSLVPRRRPQHDLAQRRSHRRDRISPGLQLRQGSRSLLQLRPGAHSGPPQGRCSTIARSSTSSSRRSSTTTAWPGCRTTPCSAASRCARANT